jgi:FixJ family two-component response regulator
VSPTLPTVFIVDDDASLRTALQRLLGAHGCRCIVFDSAEAFLAQNDPATPGCLLLDVQLPGLDGLALQRSLQQLGLALPIIFLTGHGDIPMTVRAMQAGAVNFLTKPVSAAALFPAVDAALAQDARSRQERAAGDAWQQRLASLTPRERQVLDGVVAGRLNKQIATELGIVEQTVKYHRARIMERMQVHSVAELVNLMARLAPHAGDGQPTA